MLPAIGLLIGIQSLCLYSSVARLPVALALLAFNTYPLWTALWAAVLYRQRPERALVVAMPVILVGLALALDVFGAASAWARKANGRASARAWPSHLPQAATFGLALVLTQHEAADIDGRVRTATTMAVAGLVALGTVGCRAASTCRPRPPAGAAWPP
jgi:drug/metabolite transporter (DMT)-like permease